jgi:hypothetical protein
MINNKKAFDNALWNWDILNGCFGTGKIKPTDIDGLVERNGQFLLIEAKGPGVPVKMAQDIVHRNLISLKCFTVIVIWGNPGRPIEIKINIAPFDIWRRR